MKPWQKLGEAVTPSRSVIALLQRDTELVISVDGKQLMSSRMHASEDALAQVACAAAAKRPSPCVLIGGLGMGFTLRTALDVLPRDATVVVSELVPAIVAWNRGPLAHLARRPLDDRRVVVEETDVAVVLRKSPARFDSILLDIDNGPRGLTDRANDRIYGEAGLSFARAALQAGGTLAVWSAAEDPRFERRLEKSGFHVEVRKVKGRAARGAPSHFIFLGTVKPEPGQKKRPPWARKT